MLALLTSIALFGRLDEALRNVFMRTRRTVLTFLGMSRQALSGESNGSNGSEEPLHPYGTRNTRALTLVVFGAHPA